MITKFCHKYSNGHYDGIGSGNGLWPIWYQAITYSNVDPSRAELNPPENCCIHMCVIELIHPMVQMIICP